MNKLGGGREGEKKPEKADNVEVRPTLKKNPVINIFRGIREDFMFMEENRVLSKGTFREKR